MTPKTETFEEVLQNLTYLVKDFQAEWKHNEADLSNIPFDTCWGVGLPFFTEALKLINQLKNNQPN